MTWFKAKPKRASSIEGALIELKRAMELLKSRRQEVIDREISLDYPSGPRVEMYREQISNLGSCLKIINKAIKKIGDYPTLPLLGAFVVDYSDVLTPSGFPPPGKKSASRSRKRTDREEDTLLLKFENEHVDPDEVLTRPISTRREFNRVARENKGYIVITDNASRNKIHKPDCRFVREDGFETKVILNQCKNGRYFYLKDLSFAEILYQASKCSHCLK